MCRWIVVQLMVLCLSTATNAFAQQSCGGAFDGKNLTYEQLVDVLKLYKSWLNDGAVDGDVRRANLCGANLEYAILNGANLRGANLTGANLGYTSLGETNFWEADLSGASLKRAHLWGAVLLGTNLSRADMTGADLREVLYEPKDDEPPVITSLRTAENLSRMYFYESPHALQDLRNAFKANNYRQQEREVTYAIKRSEW